VNARVPDFIVFRGMPGTGCVNSVAFGGSGPGGFDHFPEFWVFLEGLVLTRGQTRTKEKILQRVAAEDPVDNDAQFVALEINAVITDAKPMKGFPGPLKMAEVMQIAFDHFPRKAAKFAENLKLQLARHPGQFRGAGRIKNNLELHGRRLPRGNR
jgi:hypothetical protein